MNVEVLCNCRACCREHPVPSHVMTDPSDADTGSEDDGADTAALAQAQVTLLLACCIFVSFLSLPGGPSGKVSA